MKPTGEARIGNLKKKAPSLYDFVRFGADLYQVVPSQNELGLFGNGLAGCRPVLGKELCKIASITIVVREFAEDVFHPFVNGNQKCSILGIKTTVFLASAVQ